jgi:hypothetical protein
MLRRGGFGFFAPLRFLVHIAIWGLIILLVYLLFTRSGLRLSVTREPVQSAPANVEPRPEPKPDEQESENQ